MFTGKQTQNRNSKKIHNLNWRAFKLNSKKIHNLNWVKNPKPRAPVPLCKQLPHAPVAVESHLSVEEATRACSSEDTGDMREWEPEKNTQGMVTQKTQKKREKANTELLGSFLMWMKLHFTEYVSVFYTSGADRPHEDNSVLSWPHALTAIQAAASNILQMLWFLFVFYTISSSLSLLLWFVKPKPLIKHQIKMKKAHYKSILYSCIRTKLTFHTHS